MFVCVSVCFDKTYINTNLIERVGHRLTRTWPLFEPCVHFVLRSLVAFNVQFLAGVA